MNLYLLKSIQASSFSVNKSGLLITVLVELRNTASRELF